MERNNYPRNRKAKRQLNIFITSNGDINNLLLDEISAQPGFRLSKSLGDADLILNIRDNKFFFSGLTSSINFQIPLLKLNHNNICSSFHLLHQHLNPPTYDRNKQRKELKKKYLKANVESRKIVNKLNPEVDAEYATLSQRQEEIINIYEQLNNILDLPHAILSVSTFKHYEGCQIIVHEKGKQTAHSYSFSKVLGQKQNTLPVNLFNSVFNNIKKSKNRLFQAKILGEKTDFMGTFLANGFGISGHSIIFMASRNDFLPPDVAEQQYFDRFCNFLSPILKLLLSIEQITDKNNKLLMAINHLNRPVAVTGQDDQLIFMNLAFKSSEEEYVQTLHKQFIQVQLPRRQKAHIHKYDSNSITSDLFHFKKVMLLGELLNTLQHELSNPLFGIKLSGDLLTLDSQDDETTEIVEEISQYAMRCQTIIENFSYLYKDEQKHHKIDLKKLIQETVVLTKSETRNIRKHMLMPECQVAVMSNPTWITQIIFNLVINASQAIRENTEDLARNTISIELSTSGKIAKVKIIDSGPGISSEMEDQIFTPFYTTKDNGTGLGLSICRNLADKLDGKLSFENNTFTPGACFILELPLISI
ncbi:MAG: HAMP domain-containing histidine kinase [Bacteriovoracaceae bacterium]|nr:HAMP domain-containing histidine kinase [Bacteriovoracaceae bacterium]